MFQELNNIKKYYPESIEEKNTCESIIDEDMWYDIDQFQLDHLNEVLQRLSEGTLDDEIWGKLIIMEKTKRIAKAYLRKTTIIVDGGDEEFDGMTIGFNYFTNLDRDYQTAELRKKIGDGVIIKMDSQGNIKAMARGTAPVIVQNWKNSKKHCIGEKLLRLQGKLITKRGVDMNDDDRIFKVFDMKKFKISLERDSVETEEDVKNLLLKTCLRIALVKDGHPDDPMETPCWIMLINLVALDMVKTKMPHIADLNCLYGELGCPSTIPSIKRSALREQIESSNISCNSRRRSQTYYECLSDDDDNKHNSRMPSNYDNGRRKSKRNISSSDESEESNTEVNTRYTHNVVNSRFLKPYSGSITDSSSGFASGTDKRSFNSNKRSSSDLTKSVEDLKHNHRDDKKVLNPGLKIPGIRPKLDKTLFDPPHSSRRNSSLINKGSNLNEDDYEKKQEYEELRNTEELNHINNYNLVGIDDRIYVDNEKYSDERYINNNDYLETSKINEEGKDFDIGEALKNVDESFDYLQTGDYYSDSFEIEEKNWRENILSLNKVVEDKSINIENDSDDTVSSKSSLSHSNKLLLLDRYRGIRKPITKSNNYLQTIDRVRSKSSKKSKNFSSSGYDVLFNRSETIKNNSISSTFPLEIVNTSCQFFRSQEQEYTIVIWKEWGCINDEFHCNLKNSSISVVNVEYDVVKDTSLAITKNGKEIPEYKNEYDIPPCHYREYTDASSLANHLRRFNEEQNLDKKIPKNWFREKRQVCITLRNSFVKNNITNEIIKYTAKTYYHQKIGSSTPTTISHLPTNYRYLQHRRVSKDQHQSNTKLTINKREFRDDDQEQFTITQKTAIRERDYNSSNLRQSTHNIGNNYGRETGPTRTPEKSPIHKQTYHINRNTKGTTSINGSQQNTCQLYYFNQKTLQGKQWKCQSNSKFTRTGTITSELQYQNNNQSFKKDLNHPNNHINRNLPEFSNKSEPIYDNPFIKKSELQHQLPTTPNCITETVWTAHQPIQLSTPDNCPVGAVPARANLHGKKQDTEHGGKRQPTKESQESIKNNQNTTNRSVKSLSKEFESKTDRIGKITPTRQNTQQTVKSKFQKWKEWGSEERQRTINTTFSNILNTSQTNGRNRSLDTETYPPLRETSNRNRKSLSPTISNTSSTSTITSNEERNNLPNTTKLSSTRDLLSCSKRDSDDKEEQQREGRNIHESSTSKWVNKSSREREEQLLREREAFESKLPINALINIFEESSVSSDISSSFKWVYRERGGKDISKESCSNEIPVNRKSDDRRNEEKWNGSKYESIERRDNIWKQTTNNERILGYTSSGISLCGVEECNREDEEIFVKLR
uniref:MH2 domain-containing protein n=1 Tax=Strongyloides venezuelensis TaxID=75913 RepID=A0A0K0FZ08_STRVS